MLQFFSLEMKHSHCETKFFLIVRKFIRNNKNLFIRIFDLLFASQHELWMSYMVITSHYGIIHKKK